MPNESFLTGMNSLLLPRTALVSLVCSLNGTVDRGLLLGRGVLGAAVAVFKGTSEPWKWGMTWRANSS